jgi:hypothetical protein
MRLTHMASGGIVLWSPDNFAAQQPSTTIVIPGRM